MDKGKFDEEKGYFDERPEFDYQALCESEVDCTTDSAFRMTHIFKSVSGLLFSFLHYFANIVYQFY